MIKWHIILSTAVLIIMILAGVQALIIALQNHLLRYAQSQPLLKYLPPLQTMEKWLFRCITVGFILLSIVLITSIISFHPIFASPYLQKFILTLIAWFTFAALLMGRLYRGWRGRAALHWTIAGVMLLLIIYCSTGMLLHAVNS